VTLESCIWAFRRHTVHTVVKQEPQICHPLVSGGGQVKFCFLYLNHFLFTVRAFTTKHNKLDMDMDMDMDVDINMLMNRKMNGDVNDNMKTYHFKALNHSF
jgi:hypothetical protein